jgi:hypothetical protein
MNGKIEESILNALSLHKRDFEYAKTKAPCGVLEVFDHTSIRNHCLVLPPWSRSMPKAVCSEFDYFGFMIDCSHIPRIGEPSRGCDPEFPHPHVLHVGNTLSATCKSKLWRLASRVSATGHENGTDLLHHSCGR